MPATAHRHLAPASHRGRALARKCMRGVAAIEFALLLGPLVTLAGGAIEFGRAIYQYDTLAKATRNAARLLSETNPSNPAYPVAGARCMAVYGNTACTGTPLAAGLTTAMVSICDSSGSTGCTGTFANVQTGLESINLVEVRISGYPFSPLTRIFPLQGLTFNGIGTVMRQIS